jgi:hypothetical protein
MTTQFVDSDIDVIDTEVGPSSHQRHESHRPPPLTVAKSPGFQRRLRLDSHFSRPGAGKEEIVMKPKLPPLTLGTTVRTNTSADSSIPKASTSYSSGSKIEQSPSKTERSQTTLLGRTQSGWKTSRADLERPSTWKNSLGFEPMARNNPVLNRLESSSPQRFKVLPQRGFSTFLSSGGEKEWSVCARPFHYIYEYLRVSV